MNQFQQPGQFAPPQGQQQYQQQTQQFQPPQQAQQFAPPQQQYQQQAAPMVTQQNPPDDGTDIVIQGRFVWGSLSVVNKKVYGTQDDMLDKNGKPIPIIAFGLAVPKVSPQSSPAEADNFNKLWVAINTEAAKMGVQWGNPNFAWKVVDGDGKKKDGTDYPAHSKGCYIVSCETRLPVGLFAWVPENPKPVQVSDKDIKCGDYVQVNLSVSCHKPPNPGLYMNPVMVCRFAFGEAIVAMQDASKVFSQPSYIPQGASQTPVGTMPNNFAPPQFNQQPQQQFAQAPGVPNFAQPQQPQQNFQQPQAAPNFNVLPPQMQQPAQQQWQGQQQMQPAPQQYQQPVQQPAQQQWQPQQGQQTWGPQR
jgi:hypothetical protein